MPTYWERAPQKVNNFNNLTFYIISMKRFANAGSIRQSREHLRLRTKCALGAVMGTFPMISIATHYNPARAIDYFGHDLAVGCSLRPCWLGNFGRMVGVAGYMPCHA